MTKKRAIVLLWLAGELAFTGWVGWKVATARERPWAPKTIKPKRLSHRGPR